MNCTPRAQHGNSYLVVPGLSPTKRLRAIRKPQGRWCERKLIEECFRRRLGIRTCQTDKSLLPRLLYYNSCYAWVKRSAVLTLCLGMYQLDVSPVCRLPNCLLSVSQLFARNYLAAGCALRALWADQFGPDILSTVPKISQTGRLL